LEGCGEEIGKSAKDRHPRFKSSHCGKANNVGHRTLEWTGWQKISDADSEDALPRRLFDRAKLERDLTRDAGAAQNRKLHIGSRRLAQSYERGFEAIKRNTVE
jgi:hypothetical protein